MSPETEQLFHQLVDLPIAEREKFLRERGVPPGIRDEVEALLRCDSPVAVSLTGCVAMSAAESVRELSNPRGEERRYGPYRLLGLLGHGGMGSVYLGQRDDGEIEQRVAIKFLRFGGRDPLFRDHFLRERQILASLKHSAIARLLDAGHTPDGEPYLAMDYVDGVSIDQYAAGLDVAARLRLFLLVCDAVSYAHRNLVIHRDIKPSNILVDSAGDPKLLDFGIAKILDAAVGQTITVERMLTPEYGSPEQVRGMPQTAATDIYSLGAVLYKLLTGRSPHGEARGSAAEIESAICTTPPKPPSHWQRGLARDLDYILDKALRMEPEERYSSVDLLADDIRAFLESRPVKARSGNAWYRTRKFTRRYWVPMSAVALVIASLSAGLYAVNRERAIAERRFNQLRQLSSKVFELDRQIRDLPRSTEARHSIVSASLAYLEGLAPEARGNLDLTREIGEGYWRVGRIQGVPVELNLGERAKAEASLNKADELMDAVLASRPNDRVALRISGEIANDRMILAQEERRNTEAVAYARRSAVRVAALLRLKNVLEAERNEACGRYGNIALAFINMHMYDEAIPHALRSVELAQSLPAASYRVAQGLSLLASARRYQGDLDGSLQAIRQARKIAEEATYPNETARMIDLYGVLLREGFTLGEFESISLEQPEQAADALQRALGLVEEAARKDPSDAVSRSRVGTSGGALANLLRDRDPNRALATYDLADRRLAEVRTSTKSSRERAVLLAGSSYPLRALHRSPEARQRIEEAVAILKGTGDYPAKESGLESPVYSVERARADYEAAEGRVETGERILEELLAKLMASRPDAENDLRNAARISKFYEELAGMCRRSGNSLMEEQIATRRRELWHGWQLKLPDNPFVAKQVAQASTQ